MVIESKNKMKKSVLLGGCTAAVSMFLMGWVWYALIVQNIIATPSIASASVVRNKPDIILLFLGIAIINIVLALIYQKWANGPHGFVHGFKFGAILGCSVGFGLGLVWYATTNLSTLEGTLVDAMYRTFEWGISGGIIGLVHRKFGDHEIPLKDV